VPVPDQEREVVGNWQLAVVLQHKVDGSAGKPKNGVLLAALLNATQQLVQADEQESASAL
jgi:hypothetical protein